MVKSGVFTNVLLAEGSANNFIVALKLVVISVQATAETIATTSVVKGVVVDSLTGIGRLDVGRLDVCRLNVCVLAVGRRLAIISRLLTISLLGIA